MQKHVLIVSHGSRDTSANKEFLRLVRQYQLRHPRWKVAHAYLEMASPLLSEALVRSAHRARVIEVLPLFLFRAKHVRTHIPEILASFKKIHPEIKVRLAKPLGAEPLLLKILDQRLQALPKKR